MTLPIDDVWLAGESTTGVPDQRIHHTDPNSMADGSNGALMNPQNGSNGAHMNPQNGSNGVDRDPSSNHPADAGHGRPRTFDPRSFDPGPDLPPLPTLRPLPTIKPMATWPPKAPPAQAPDEPRTPDEPAAPVAATATAATEAPTDADAPAGPDAAVVEPADVSPEPSDPTDLPPATGEPADDRTIRVSGLSIDGGVDDIVAGPVGSAPVAPATGPGTPAPTIRRRRRATDFEDGAPESLEAAGSHAGQRVLVLGGSGTVGREIARSLAARGARLAVHHATRGPLAGQLVQDLPGTGHLAVGADLADADAVADLIASVDAQFDGLDVVINAATAGDSIGRPALVGSSLSDWTDAWTGALTVDMLGAATVVHAAAAAFIARGRGGRIILVAAKGRAADDRPSSVAAATEQAVGALGSALAAELAPHGVGLTVVGSGSASSAGWSPEALAEAVVWLASGPTASLAGAVFTIAG
ncbi:Short-chain dehydrogenase [Nakamurella panacisegetis]|uniref:Short-chain dehydrogenase n=1 Tax=Nakamurella panacisegetis TaxID=1090615 RepID=A0A1H0K8W9_9ACTN|nr:SDR family oxidoreductase [Nakamurella panacisegetis]SDO52334.1 Short-chain dehydrogenase [Nakamurella panacisegetis]